MNCKLKEIDMMLQPTPNVQEEAAPVAEPMPPKDGSKPIPEGSDEVEKFLVATDTEGGD